MTRIFTDSANQFIDGSLRRWYGPRGLETLLSKAEEVSLESNARVVGRNHLQLALARNMHKLPPLREPRPRPAGQQTNLEAHFWTIWKLTSSTLVVKGWAPRGPLSQFPFIPTRRYLADFAWPLSGVIVECEGGIFTGQAHGSIRGILNDIRKANAAQMQGWVFFRVHPRMLTDDPWDSLAPMLRTIARRETAGWVSAWGPKDGIGSQ